MKSLFIALVATFVLSTLANDDSKKRRIYSGAYTNDMDTYIKNSGHTPAIRLEFFNVNQGGFESEEVRKLLRNFCGKAAGRREIPMVTIEPTVPVDQLYSESYQRIADDIADSCKDQHVILRFAHEMNGFWYDNWDEDGPRYKNAFCGMSNAVKSSKIKMLWAPNAEWEGMKNDYEDFWSGDQCNVDMVGLSFYQKRDKAQYSEEQNFIGVVTGADNGDTGTNFYEKYSKGKGLPFIIAETAASTSSGLDNEDENKGKELKWKLDWVKQLYSTEALDAFPNMRAVVWFDTTKDGMEHGIFNRGPNIYVSLKAYFDQLWKDNILVFAPSKDKSNQDSDFYTWLFSPVSD